jgi:hypothetical protein
MNEEAIRYAGIGSRASPASIKKLMTEIASYFGIRNWVLRSGGAHGADTAFEIGCDLINGKKEIFTVDSVIPAQAFEIAKEFHPAWTTLNEYTKRLHGRNSMIILGPDLTTPVKLVICYTSDGGFSGGTGMSMFIAKKYNIPIFNLRLEKIRKQFEDKIKNG